MSDRRAMIVIAALVLVAAVTTAVVLWRQQSADESFPLRPVGEISLPGGDSRFDYMSLDSGRGRLFIAHLGASEVVEVDLRARRVVRTIPDIAEVHGVLVVPALRRVYATATGDDQLVTIDAETGAELHRSPTGDYPDGLAYDPRRGAIWTTNQSGGSETVIDARTGAVRGTAELGGSVGNVAYDPEADQILVAVQGRNELAVIDPSALRVFRRIPLPGCDHDHGLVLDPPDRLAFVACDGNATLLTVDLPGGRVTGRTAVGETPDVLAYDQAAHRLYVAGETGTITVLNVRDRRATTVGSKHLADDAHAVAVDPASHHSFYPVPRGETGRPALLVQR